VFADRDALETLNRIVHPLIAQEIQARLAAALQAGDVAVVIEAALLLEAGRPQFVHVVWVVVTPQSAVIERVHAQRGLAPSDIEARIAAQTTDEQRRRLADVVIENAGSIEDLRRTVDALWARVVGTAGPAR
jgi:dephospho-CoA kinase